MAASTSVIPMRAFPGKKRNIHPSSEETVALGTSIHYLSTKCKPVREAKKNGSISTQPNIPQAASKG